MTFIKTKKINRIDDIDVDKILISKKKPYGTKNSYKYFIGYNDNDVLDHCAQNFHKRLVILIINNF